MTDDLCTCRVSHLTQDEEVSSGSVQCHYRFTIQEEELPEEEWLVNCSLNVRTSIHC